MAVSTVPRKQTAIGHYRASSLHGVGRTVFWKVGPCIYIKPGEPVEWA